MILNILSIAASSNKLSPIHFTLLGNFEHVGNRRLRVLISTQLERYVSAKTRFEKSNVIDLVVDQVQEAAGPVGGFVKRDGNGAWFQMTKSLARDKVSHKCMSLWIKICLDLEVCRTSSSHLLCLVFLSTIRWDIYSVILQSCMISRSNSLAAEPMLTESYILLRKFYRYMNIHIFILLHCIKIGEDCAIKNGVNSRHLAS